MNPYQGLVHDSRLYTLQALNHLRPDLFGNDVFLKFGSQDNFTLFTPIHAGMITAFGPEVAASLITFLSTSALLAAAWWLATVIMPLRLAVLGLAIFVTMPTYYGADRGFAVLEGFATPRMLSEALILLTLAAWLTRRRVMAGATLVIAFLIHPLMAFPGLVLLVTMEWILPRWRKLWPALPALGMLLIPASLGWLPLNGLQFDESWWPVAQWAPHLLPSSWEPRDWARIATLSVTLIAASRMLPAPAGRLAAAVVVTTALTLLLAWAGGDLLRIAIVVQGQAWRSLWIATAIAALALPWLLLNSWHQGPLRKTAAMLLCGAWLIGYQDLALFLSVPALGAYMLPASFFGSRASRIVELGAVVVVALILICMIALNISARDGQSEWYLQTRDISKDGVLPLALLALVAALCWHNPSARRASALLALVALPAAAIAKHSLEPWTKRTYTNVVYEAFSEWRKIVPPGTDVLWATTLLPSSDPSATWLILERPSYFSSVQSNSGLFSREAAMELQQRRKAIPLSLPTERSRRIVVPDADTPSCSNVPSRYIVTNQPITGATTYAAPANAGPLFGTLQLRVCNGR